LAQATTSDATPMHNSVPNAKLNGLRIWISQVVISILGGWHLSLACCLLLFANRNGLYQFAKTESTRDPGAISLTD
jgi:hypothetical protein